MDKYGKQACADLFLLDRYEMLLSHLPVEPMQQVKRADISRCIAAKPVSIGGKELGAHGYQKQDVESGGESKLTT